MITISGGTPVVIIENGNERELMYNLPEGGITPAGSQTFTENGTYDVTEIAEAIVNVASGSDGLEYEEGVWTPTEDASDSNILFANSHTTLPIFVMLTETSSQSIDVPDSNVFVVLSNLYTYLGYPIVNGTFTRYGTMGFTYTTAIGLSSTNSNFTSETTLNTFLSATSFRAYTNSDTRYWRSGRTYKWIAVWAPETS